MRNREAFQAVSSLFSLSVTHLVQVHSTCLSVFDKFVPKLLTEQQNELRKEIVEDMLDVANHDPEFIETIITGDETWDYGYDPEAKFQSAQWKHPESPRPKKARQVRSNVKVMLTCFFDSRGIVHH